MVKPLVKPYRGLFTAVHQSRAVNHPTSSALHHFIHLFFQLDPSTYIIRISGTILSQEVESEFNIHKSDATVIVVRTHILFPLFFLPLYSDTQQSEEIIKTAKFESFHGPVHNLLCICASFMIIIGRRVSPQTNRNILAPCPVMDYLQHKQTDCNRQTTARPLSLPGTALASHYLCPFVTHIHSLSICYTQKHKM